MQVNLEKRINTDVDVSKEVSVENDVAAEGVVSTGNNYAGGSYGGNYGASNGFAAQSSIGFQQHGSKIIDNIFAVRALTE